MAYRGDQDHWYGPGEHLECGRLNAADQRCGHCTDCGGGPRGRDACAEHAEAQDAAAVRAR